MKTGSANVTFLCNFSQLFLSNINLFTVLFTADVRFFFVCFQARDLCRSGCRHGLLKIGLIDVIFLKIPHGLKNVENCTNTGAKVFVFLRANCCTNRY